MKQNIILSNFKPILIGKLMDQTLLNEYFKFLYYHFQKNAAKQFASQGDFDFHNVDYEEVAKHVDKYGVSAEFINQRQILIFEELEEFIQFKIKETAIEDYPLPQNFKVTPEQKFGPKIEARMRWYREKMKNVFDTFYEANPTKPENLVHVTCSGYASPSIAQEAVITRGWTHSQVTHSYQMGCYGAFPAIRTATGLMNSSHTKGRIDIIHTELLSAHLNLTEFTPSNTMICSLFADGFVGYSMYDEETFLNDETITNKNGLKILAFHEVIIPDSLEDMSWDLGEYNFVMTLSKRVPVFIRKHIKEFLTDLCTKGGVDIEAEKYKMHFAIHPGGPKIIDYIVDEMDLFKEQAIWSYEVLRKQGNMSSATIPHIFDEILKDNSILPGTKIVAMAFGPGLTATSLLLEKI